MLNNLKNNRILLIGAGPMAVDYAKVLQGLEVPFDVIGRGESSANLFKEKTNILPITGGLSSYKGSFKAFSHAVVASSVESLAENTIALCKAGIKNILVEKPGGLDLDEISQVKLAAAENNTAIYVAYNRRFYASVKKLKELVALDGGVTSFNFEFTEWVHLLEKKPRPENVKNYWLLANSTHVIDLAFYLGGKPKELSAYHSGNLSWHTYSVFTGSGVTENNAVFSYHSNWESAGRWSVEVLTNANKYILRPMEELAIQKRGKLEIIGQEIDNFLDTQYKPGLYEQVKAFLSQDTTNLISIAEQTENVKEIYNKIAGYR